MKRPLTALALSPGLASFAPAATQQWKQVWSDEFDYTGAPDPAEWGHEFGRIRNGEAQAYTKRAGNVTVGAGVLDDGHGRLERRPWPKDSEIGSLENVANDPYVNHGSIHYAGTDNAHHQTTAAYDPPHANFDARCCRPTGTRSASTGAPATAWSGTSTTSSTRPSHSPRRRCPARRSPTRTTSLRTTRSAALGGAVDPNFVSDKYQVDYVRVSQMTTVPEPGAVGVLGVIACGLLKRRRRG